MTEGEMKVIAAMSDEWVYPFERLAEMTGLSKARVRSIVRNFKSRGWTMYGPVFDEDEPFLRGSGYTLTSAGLGIRDIILEGTE